MKKSASEWIEGELLVTKGQRQSIKRCQLVGDTLFFFEGSENVSGFLELRNVTLLSMRSPRADVVVFRLPVKDRWLGSRLNEYIIRPKLEHQYEVWIDSLRIATEPIMGGVLQRQSSGMCGMKSWSSFYFQLQNLCVVCYTDVEHGNPPLGTQVPHSTLSLVPECSVHMVDRRTLEVTTQGGGGHSAKLWLLRGTEQEIAGWNEGISAAISRKVGDIPLWAQLEMLPSQQRLQQRMASYDPLAHITDPSPWSDSMYGGAEVAIGMSRHDLAGGGGGVGSGNGKGVSPRMSGIVDIGSGVMGAGVGGNGASPRLMGNGHRPLVSSSSGGVGGVGGGGGGPYGSDMRMPPPVASFSSGGGMMMSAAVADIPTRMMRKDNNAVGGPGADGEDWLGTLSTPRRLSAGAAGNGHGLGSRGANGSGGGGVAKEMAAAYHPRSSRALLPDVHLDDHPAIRSGNGGRSGGAFV